MVEITEMNVNDGQGVGGKVENDRSYRNDSGVSTDNSSNGHKSSKEHSSGYDSINSESTDGSWIKMPNEVVDPVSFDPPCLQSSDLVPKSKIWDLSSIENTGNVPKSTKGIRLRQFQF